MFTPTSKLKKILGTYGTCAYIHRDGVVILERKEVKVKGGNSANIEVWHIVPCAIRISERDYSKNYSWSDAPKVDRLVIHDCSLIANGFDAIDVIFSNCSDSTKQLGIVINQVKFTQGYHTWTDTSIANMFGSAIAIQPNPYERWSSNGDKSVTAYLDYQYRNGNSVVVYGDLPEEKPEVLQLTVSQ